MKPIRVRLTYQDGTIYLWTVKRVPRAYNAGFGITKRIISGWEYTDHEGCARFAEGNWNDLVAAFHATAENYGMTCNLS